MSVAQRSLTGLIVSVFLLCGLSGCAALDSTADPAATAPATSPVTPTSTVQVAKPTSTAKPNGPPYVGGLYVNFVAKFGAPIGQEAAGSENFYADSQQSILLNVSSAKGIVINLGVLGPQDWSDTQTFTYCTGYLPPGVTQFNHVADLWDYHSSVGTVIIHVLGSGSCQVYLGS